MGSLLSLVLATENRHKQNEFQQALGPQFKLFTLSDLGFRNSLPLETGQTYEENSSIKAIYVGQSLGLPVLSDDSGFEVEALGGVPGVHSARFLGGVDSKIQCQEILKRLEGEENRRARFVCVLSLYLPSRKSIQSFRGECCGTVSESMRGDKGFGYDPIFIPEDARQTFAEMNSIQKWKISHRGRAFESLKGYWSALESATFAI